MTNDHLQLHMQCYRYYIYATHLPVRVVGTFHVAKNWRTITATAMVTLPYKNQCFAMGK